MEALDLQGLRFGGDSWTRTNGLTSLRSFGQVRYSRDPRLGAAVSLLSSPRFRIASSATGGALLRAHDVNDVLCQLSQDIQLKLRVRNRWSL